MSEEEILDAAAWIYYKRSLLRNIHTLTEMLGAVSFKTWNLEAAINSESNPFEGRSYNYFSDESIKAMIAKEIEILTNIINTHENTSQKEAFTNLEHEGKGEH